MAGRVLVVDDNEINGLMVENILNHYGIECQCALSGREALDFAKNERFALVFMDYLMPEMNGIETTRRMKEYDGYLEIPIIALSGDADEEIGDSFRAVGACGVMSKPIEPAAITKALEEHGLLELNAKENTSANDSASTEETISEAADSQSGTENGDLRDILADLEELDYETGLRNSMGSVKNYYLVMKAGVKNIEECSERIETFLNAENKRSYMKVLRIALHSLKSIFLNIGVAPASKEAAKLERYVKDIYDESRDVYGELDTGKLDELRSFHDINVSALETLRHAVDSYGEMQKSRMISRENKKAEMSQAEFDEVLGEAKEALRLFDIDSLTRALERLLQGAKNEEMSALIEECVDAAGIFNYDLISENLLKIDRGEAR